MSTIAAGVLRAVSWIALFLGTASTLYLGYWASRLLGAGLPANSPIREIATNFQVIGIVLVLLPVFLGVMFWAICMTLSIAAEKIDDIYAETFEIEE